VNVAELRVLLEKHEDDAEVMVIDDAGQSSDVAPVLGEADIGEVVFIMLTAGSAITATPNDIEARLAAASASETKAWSELRRIKADLRGALEKIVTQSIDGWATAIAKNALDGGPAIELDAEGRISHPISTRQGEP
jgi:hypothetical protein